MVTIKKPAKAKKVKYMTNKAKAKAKRKMCVKCGAKEAGFAINQGNKAQWCKTCAPGGAKLVKPRSKCKGKGGFCQTNPCYALTKNPKRGDDRFCASCKPPHAFPLQCCEGSESNKMCKKRAHYGLVSNGAVLKARWCTVCKPDGAERKN